MSLGLTGSFEPSRLTLPFAWVELDNTVRYLGIDIEDALALAEATDI